MITEDLSRGDSQAWVAALRGPTAIRREATAELHALLLRGARFELSRSRSALGHVPAEELDNLATQAADEALGAVVASLDSFRGTSRFTTWASKFVLREAGVALRRRAWRGREVSFEGARTLRAIRPGVQESLTPLQREVFAALVLNDVPIDVLAERLSTTRADLYRTLHDARRKLRVALIDAEQEPAGRSASRSSAASDP
ncbi:MAG: sigma-70 family RNA polymerase sigma factor [Solirubrobacteraceae bacterium]